MRKTLCLFGLIVWISCVYSLGAFAWNQLPLLTESPGIQPSGQFRFDIGLTYLHKRNFGFSPYSEQFSRNVLSCPTLGFSIGLGRRVEVQASYETLFVEEQEFQIREVWKTGDLAFFTKVAFWDEQHVLPQTGIRIGVKLPNAANQYRVGTDETDFTFSTLFEKRFSTLTTTANLGILVLGDPTRNAQQDDLLSYGLACTYQKGGVRYKVDVTGQAFGSSHNELASVLFHLLVPDGKLTWNISGRMGLVGNSEDWGVSGGVSIQSDLLTHWASEQ